MRSSTCFLSLCRASRVESCKKLWPTFARSDASHCSKCDRAVSSCCWLASSAASTWRARGDAGSAFSQIPAASSAASKARVPRDFGRTLRDARVARFARELEIGGNRDLRLAALLRDLGEHQLEHELLGQLDVGQRGPHCRLRSLGLHLRWARPAAPGPACATCGSRTGDRCGGFKTRLPRQAAANIAIGKGVMGRPPA